MNAIPALPLSVLAGLARTHGNGKWIDREIRNIPVGLSALNKCTCSPASQGSSVALQEEFSSVYTAHLVIADSPLFLRLNKSTSLSFSLHIMAWGHLGTSLVALGQTCCGLLKSSLYWGAQSWTQYSRYDLKYQLEGKTHFPLPAGYAFANTAQHASGLLCCQSTLLIHVQPLFKQKHRVFFCKAAL